LSWDKKIEEQYTYDDDQLLKKFKKVAKDDGNHNSILSDDLPLLCDRLGLSILMISDKMNHYFKYVDCVNGTAQKYVDDGHGHGYIDFTK
jgi:hypothetical protein